MRKKREKDNNRHEREATAQLAVLETPSDLRNMWRNASKTEKVKG